MQRTRTAESVAELPAIAKWVMDKVRSRHLAIEGAMGAGKTTFVKALCAYMNIADRVSSPTFSLVNEYHSPTHGPVYHFDFYRLENEEEALDIGLEEYFSSSSWCLMEWPEKIRNFLPDDHEVLHIVEESGRRIFEIKTSNS